MSVKGELLARLWGKDAGYYRKAAEHVVASRDAGEYAWLRRWVPPGLVLEVGCGDGVHFDVLADERVSWVGCDLSALAVALAKKRGLARALVVADAEALPFASGTFQGVLAVSVLEHLEEPERALDAMIGVLAPKGRLILVSPQYGAPLGASPSRRGGGAARFAARWVRTHLPVRAGVLGWDRVDPAVLAGAVYEGDEDTVVEPELRTLVAFLAARGMRVLDATSGLTWTTWRRGRMSLGQRTARALLEPLGRIGLPPYRWWGPLVCVCAERG
jgi:SAM-dependent methyltransferase